MESGKNEFDSTNLFFFALRWWKHLAILCVVAALAAAIFSGPYFITPKFESSVSMFPASTSSISRSVLGGPSATRIDFLQYGDVEDAERLLQVLGSAAMRDRVTERFNLMEHYRIPGNSRYRHTYLKRTYQENISFRRTKYGAVEIRVRDRDPDMAAAIANGIAEQIDSLQNSIRLGRAVQAYQVARSQYNDMLRQVRNAEDSLRLIMRMGVYDVEAQTSMLTQQLAIDLSRNNPSGVSAIEERLNVLGEHAGSYLFLSNYLTSISTTMTTLQRRVEEARVDMENIASFKFIIDPAYVAERKVYPVRWLIVVLTTFAAGFGGVITLMLYENLQRKGILAQRSQKPAKPS